MTRSKNDPCRLALALMYIGDLPNDVREKARERAAIITRQFWGRIDLADPENGAAVLIFCIQTIAGATAAMVDAGMLRTRAGDCSDDAVDQLAGRITRGEAAMMGKAARVYEPHAQGCAFASVAAYLSDSTEEVRARTIELAAPRLGAFLERVNDDLLRTGLDHAGMRAVTRAWLYVAYAFLELSRPSCDAIYAPPVEPAGPHTTGKGGDA